MPNRKFALVHLGNDVVYGLEFVAAEILRLGQEIRWFDGDLPDAAEQIAGYAPDFVCLSPLTTFFRPAAQLCARVKKLSPQTKTVFGGHHVSAVPEVVEMEEIDLVVAGPVYGAIERILAGATSGTITGQPVPLDRMVPASREYFSDIPRIGGRHRKPLMSHFGCVYNCSYCANSRVRKAYGGAAYKKFWLTRRPIPNLIREAKVFLEFPTTEVAMEDDDILYGPHIEAWLDEFVAAWKAEIRLPMYAFVTPNTVERVSGRTLELLAGLVSTVAMGVQSCRPESLKLLNRHFQDEKQVKRAFDRLQSFGLRTKIEMIIGLPVANPIEDAIESVKFAQRVGAGTFGVAFPLMLYPGTALYTWCKANNVPLNEDCTYEWYNGIGSVRFDPETSRMLRNLSKLSTFFIKYNIDERWMRSLIKMDLNEESSRAISEGNYLESLVFRLGEPAREHFDEILKKTNFTY